MAFTLPHLDFNIRILLAIHLVRSLLVMYASTVSSAHKLSRFGMRQENASDRWFWGDNGNDWNYRTCFRDSKEWHRNLDYLSIIKLQRTQTNIDTFSLRRFNIYFLIFVVISIHAKYSTKAIKQRSDRNCVEGNSEHTKEQADDPSSPGKVHYTPFSSQEHSGQIQAVYNVRKGWKKSETSHSHQFTFTYLACW